MAITINGKKEDCITPTHEYVIWSYPEIYKEKQSTLTISLEHTRAADDIRIKYNSERDGWIIEQASIFEWNTDDTNGNEQDWQEVAFIGAWARQKIPPPEQQRT